MERPYGIAVVTGAGSGIGAAIARGLAVNVGTVCLVGRTAAKLERVAEQIAADGGSAEVLPADVGDPAAIDVLASDIRDRFDRVDVLANNAAVLAVKPFEEFRATEVEEHFATNLKGPFLLTQALLPLLRVSGDAAVLNVSSVAASVPRAGSTLYGATKAGLEYLTRCLAVELAPDGIRVNAIAPGPVDTPIHDGWLQDPKERSERLSDVPLGRPGRAEEVAWWAVELCGGNGSWITGAMVPIDGGKALGAAPPYV
ncbi:MAG: SDR family oxidoreductase [Dehalococcoidia bacterium]